MSKTVITVDQHSSVVLPPEVLDSLGVEAGEQVEIEIVGRALVIRSVEEAKRSREFISAFESILYKRRAAYEEIAEDPDLRDPGKYRTR
jgi:antitoxin component of MazEF toxin-antitoxin module